MEKIEEYGPTTQAYFFSDIFPPRLIKKEYFGQVGKVDKEGNHFIGERCWSYQQIMGLQVRRR
jgi:hypothetical protein